jgi:hypothetical protein
MTKRRGRGEGSIFFDKRANLWVGQINIVDGSGRRRRPKVTGQTKREVSDKLQALRAQAASGRPQGMAN